MNHLKNTTIVLLFSLIFFTCTEEITLNTDFEPQTIIFGNLKSGTHDLGIFIAQTVPVDSQQDNPINDAKISLFTKSTDGEVSLVLDSFTASAGYYQSTDQVTPVIGNYYWIEVTLADGTLYRSSEEKLNAIVPIDSYNFVDNTMKLGISDPDSESNFYFTSVSIYYNSSDVFNKFVVTSDALFNGNDEAFIEIEDVFNIGTPFDIELSNVSYNTFKFYEKLLIQTDANNIGDDSGPDGLFATPPVNLKGNILNTSNNKTAIGNFGVLATSEYSE